MGLVANGPLYSRLSFSYQENASQLRWSVARDDEYIYFLLQYIQKLVVAATYACNSYQGSEAIIDKYLAAKNHVAPKSFL